MSYYQAMEAAGANVLAFQSFGSYQGDWWAKVEFNDITFFVSGSYGSCSGCDAFEGEFGWENGRCSDHEYDEAGSVGCPECAERGITFQKRLSDFGLAYLTNPWTQEEAIKEASRNLDWDSDAQEMVDWLKAA